MPIHTARFQIPRGVNKHLVNGIDVYILGSNVLEVNLIDTGAVIHIMRHSRRRYDITDSKRWIFVQLVYVVGLTYKLPCLAPTLVVDLLHLLDDLKQSGTTGNTEGFQ